MGRRNPSEGEIRKNRIKHPYDVFRGENRLDYGIGRGGGGNRGQKNKSSRPGGESVLREPEQKIN